METKPIDNLYVFGARIEPMEMSDGTWRWVVSDFAYEPDITMTRARRWLRNYSHSRATAKRSCLSRSTGKTEVNRKGEKK